MREFVENDAGYIVRGMDPVAMAEVLAGLHADRSGLEQTGKNALKKVKWYHDIELWAPRVAELIERLHESAKEE